MQAFEQQCPDKIYLLDMGEDMPVWCDDASPDYDDRFSVEYIRADVARAESAKELAEKDAEIERLKRVNGSFRYALLKYREDEWLGGEDGIAARALESEAIANTKKED
jgi:hypothetical protein